MHHPSKLFLFWYMPSCYNLPLLRCTVIWEENSFFFFFEEQKWKQQWEAAFNRVLQLPMSHAYGFPRWDFYVKNKDVGNTLHTAILIFSGTACVGLLWLKWKQLKCHVDYRPPFVSRIALCHRIPKHDTVLLEEWKWWIMVCFAFFLLEKKNPT